MLTLEGSLPVRKSGTGVMVAVQAVSKYALVGMADDVITAADGSACIGVDESAAAWRRGERRGDGASVASVASALRSASSTGWQHKRLS